MAQAQRVAPSPHLAQIVAIRLSPDCRPACRLEQLAKALRVDLAGWWWWVVPVPSNFGLPLGAGRRPSLGLVRIWPLAGVRATTTNFLTYFS